MRKLIAEFGKGGARDEDWVYLEFDEKTGQFFYVHEWSYTPYKIGPTDAGTICKPLHEATDEKHYRQAVSAVQGWFERS